MCIWLSLSLFQSKLCNQFFFFFYGFYNICFNTFSVLLLSPGSLNFSPHSIPNLTIKFKTKLSFFFRLNLFIVLCFVLLSHLMWICRLFFYPLLLLLRLLYIPQTFSSRCYLKTTVTHVWLLSLPSLFLLVLLLHSSSYSVFCNGFVGLFVTFSWCCFVMSYS